MMTPIPTVLPGALPLDLCRALIAQGQGFERSQLERPELPPGIRTSTEAWVPAALEAQVADVLYQATLELNAQWNYELSALESPRLLRYQAGQAFDWHDDIGEGPLAARKISLIGLLSAPSAVRGGRLEFVPGHPTLPLTQGSLIVFPSYLVHRVQPVVSGERWAVASWALGPAPIR